MISIQRCIVHICICLCYRFLTKFGSFETRETTMLKMSLSITILSLIFLITSKDLALLATTVKVELGILSLTTWMSFLRMDCALWVTTAMKALGLLHNVQ